MKHCNAPSGICSMLNDCRASLFAAQCEIRTFCRWNCRIKMTTRFDEEMAMKHIFQLLAASTLALGVASGPLFAQTQEKAAPAKDEKKMDAKGVPGSTD